LLKHQPALVITEDIVKAAAANFGSGAEVMQLVLKHQPALD
jgi:hypothetical protein